VDLKDTPERAAYRERVRGWLQENGHHAPDEANGSHIKDVEDFRAWQRRLAEAGYAAVMWPTEYGGQGLGPMEQAIVNSELTRAGLPGILDIIYAGYAPEYVPDELTRAAGCARVSGEHALDYATRTCIAVHGGVGATWEHDAHLYYRRALLSRLQYGGEGFAAERVTVDLLASAAVPPDGAFDRLGQIRI
jgi:alkylation response protein AidB-like acyl-CoA dehydrogenase